MTAPGRLGESLSRYLASLESLVRPAEELAEYSAARAHEALSATADSRGVPGARDIRDWCLRPRPEGDAADAVTRALDWRRKYGTRQPGVLILLGRTGTRKTVALAHAVAHHAGSAHYTTAAELLRNREYEAREAYSRARSANLLALDEIGDEPDPGSLVALLLERWTRGGFTLLAGNLEPGALVERYFRIPSGVKLADRLRGQRGLGLRAQHSISERESSR